MSFLATEKGTEEESPQEEHSEPLDPQDETQRIDYEEESESESEMSTPGTPTRRNNVQKENRVVVITGELEEDRAKIESKLEKLGYVVSPVLPKKRQANVVLVCGKNPKRGKREEAALLGVPVCEASFVDALLVSKQAKVDVKDHLVSDSPYRLRPTSSLPELSYHNRRTPKSPRKASTIAVVQRARTKPLTSSIVGDPNASRTLEGARIVIALEGEIGVGKSTLSKKIAECFPASTHVFQEPVNEKFLNLFYGDTKRYGFAFQWGMLKSRLFQLQLAKHSAVCSNPSTHLASSSGSASITSSASSSAGGRRDSHQNDPQRDKMVPTFYFWDRSMIGDYIFALWNHLTGGITAQEFEVYESEFGGGIDRIDQLPFLQDISFFVFLNDEPERCKYRVEHQRGNQSEQGIPLSYYEGLDDIHFDLFLRVLTTDALSVLVMSFGQYDDPMSCRQRFCDIFTGKTKSPRIRWMEAADAPTKEECRRGRAVLDAVSLGKVTKFYDTEADIVRAYNEVVKPSYPPHPRDLLNKATSSSSTSSLSEATDAPATPTKPRAPRTPKKASSTSTSSPALSSTSSSSSSSSSFTGVTNEVILFSHEAWSSCLLDPQEKGVVVTPSPVDFYRNEFKRLVLWHLSKGHEVVLVRSPPTPLSVDGDVTDETDTDI